MKTDSKPIPPARDPAVIPLRTLNTNIKKQMSTWHTLRTGIIHGIGFVIGSTILTAIVVTLTLHFFGGTPLGDVISWLAEKGR